LFTHVCPQFFDFDAIGGVSHLTDDLKLLPPDFQRLIPNITGCDPDEAFSGVPYEKGFSFLLTLERRVGTPAFEEFAKAYLKKFKFITVTSTEFKEYFESYFAPGDKLTGLDWDAWFHEPGLPQEMPSLDRTLSSGSELLAAAWVKYDRSGGDAPSVDISKWITNQTTCFLDAVLTTIDKDGKNLKAATTWKMDELYQFSKSKNTEKLSRYCKLAIGAEQASILPVVLKFITSQGRMKFTRPLYRALYASKMGRASAIKTFKENKAFYHAICQKMISTDMGLDEEGGEGSGEAVQLFKGINANVVVGVAATAVVLGLVFMRKRR